MTADLKHNETKCLRLNRTFSNSRTRTDSVAKRAISTPAHSQINWTEKNINKKENRMDYFEKRSR